MFKLQFQATQVPQSKKTTLTIALIPEDVGKPTVRLEKAAVQDGICSWKNPVYETVKLVKDLKTGKINEKIYHFIVSTGSSKAGFLGEVSIDFGDFADATLPSTVSLPLSSSNSAPILHVTIQNMQRVSDQRDEDRHQTVTSQGMSLNNQMGNYNIDANGNLTLTDDSELNITASQNTQQNGSSETISRQNSIPENGTAAMVMTQSRQHRRSNTDWSVDSASDGSLADLTYSPQDNFTRERLQETSDDPFEQLKNENAMLMRQAEVAALELQSLRKLIVKETKKGQDLSRQVGSLKEEKYALKTEYEKLKSFKRTEEDSWLLLEEIRKNLDYEKELNACLQLQIQEQQVSEKLVKENEDRKEINSLKEQITELYGEIELYKKEKEELEMHIEQLSVNYDNLRKEKHDLSLKLDQNECSSSLITIKELETQVEILETEMKSKTQNFSESLNTIKDFETQVKSLETELEKQAERFEDDLEAMTQNKIKQEQRAIRAEESLRKTRWKNAVSAEQLQEEFKKLSVEMTSKLDENEKLATKEMAEANELRLQKSVLEEMVQKANEELGFIEDRYRIQLRELSNQIDMKEKQMEAVYAENETLKSRIERLRAEKNEISEKAKQREILRDEMEQTKTLIVKKEIIVGTLSAEMEKLRTQTNELKHNLFEEELEKENLKNQVTQLKGNLQKKEDEIISMEKRVMTSRNNKSSSLPCDSEEVANLQKKLRLLEEQIRLKEVAMENSTNSFLKKEKDLNIKIKDLQNSMEKLSQSRRRVETSSEKEKKTPTSNIREECNLKELLTEVALLRERNKSMEGELKEMQERYSEISLKFAEVEGERQQLVMTVRNLKNGKKN